MRSTRQASIVLLCISLLSACAKTPGCPPAADASPHQDIWQETWHKHLTVPARQWTTAADRWFFSGEPSANERRLSKTPIDQGLTVSAVRVPSFTDVRINGCFQTQIIGHQDQNSLYIAGTHDAIQQLPVEMDHNRLYIGQTTGPACLANLRHVIVRIGVRNLKNLAVYGGGRIEGRNISSNGMTIKLSGNGDTLLAGDLRVRHIDLLGDGTLTLLGANTPELTINAPGNGHLRIQGKVGIQSIHHTGNGNINIVGASSKCLTLDTAGNGTTALQGLVNLTAVTAAGNSRVYVADTNSAYIRVKGSANSEIGLSGHVDTLEISLKDCARFWGAGLQSRITYVATLNSSHANVTALSRLFAKASDDSCIYYSSASGNVSQFLSGRGVILRMGDPAPWKSTTTGWAHAYK